MPAPNPSFSRGLASLPAVLVLLLAAKACASPTLKRAATATFSLSCKDIAYYGYCRVEANCTTDGSTAADGKSFQHTFLDLGQCVGYNARSETLQWRDKTVAHWQSNYCEPCSQCSISPNSTLSCQCQYTNTQHNHESYLVLDDHVYNQNGVLGCLNVAGDPDPNA